MDVLVLLSGGVDSSVSLRLLQDQGCRVVACYIKIWLEDELSFLGSCPWEDDLAVVRSVCRDASVPLEIISLQREYHERVVAQTIEQIRMGYTPNPDVLCNVSIKFGAVLDYLPADVGHVATGHYAQIVRGDARIRLMRSPDNIKDQTYFLALLRSAQLRRAYFPVGHLTKPEVRALAEQYNLPNKNRKDSQGICFLGKLSFEKFILYHLGERAGHLIEYETGRIVGAHKGFWFYTIGQRQGIGLSGGPWYVVAKQIDENIVFISRAYHQSAIRELPVRTQFRLKAVNWLHLAPVNPELLTVKLRHGAYLHTVLLTPLEDGWHGRLHVPDQGIAPGQYAVFYRDTECLGGGMICSTE